MPVPATIADLSTDEALNSPTDADTITPSTRPSDYLRAHAAIIKQFATDTGISTGFLQTGTGAVTRTALSKMQDVVSVFDFMTTAQIADVQAGTLGVDVTAALQAAIDAARGKRIHLPKGRYKTTAALVINSVVTASATPFIMYGDGFDANGGTGGTSINYSGVGNGISIVNTGGTDTYIELRDFGVFGDGVDAAGGNGVDVNNCANVRLRNLWIQNARNAGVYFYRCYGSSIEDSYIYSNRVYGIYSNEAFNLGSIVRCKTYNNGKIWTQETSNIKIAGVGNENLGVVIIDTDVSFSGAGVSWYKRSDASLTNISVAAGTATATTGAAHGRTTGDVIFVTGATVDANLNSTFSKAITVTGPTTFTFTTTAADATYNEATLSINPYSTGLSVAGTRGLVVGAYAEDCAGPAAYLGDTVYGFEFNGGYWQGVTGSGLVLVDNASNGKFGAMYFSGANAGISLQMTERPHAVDLQSSCVFASSSSAQQSAVAMRDGQYYSASTPVAGTWSAGTILHYPTPEGGLPVMRLCTVAGTPGTWIPTGIVQAVYADQGDAAATLTYLASYPTNIWATPLTVDRAVTLSTTGAVTGAKFKIVRAASATGAFNLNVGTGPLKALGIGQWCEVEYDGAAWVLTAYGAL